MTIFFAFVPKTQNLSLDIQILICKLYCMSFFSSNIKRVSKYQSYTSLIDYDIDRRAHYYILFKIRHPIAWLLWYRWRLPMPLTAEERLKFFSEARKRNFLHSSCSCSNDDFIAQRDEFALYHPFLFFFADLFQIFKTLFTRFSKKIFSIRKCSNRDDCRISNVEVSNKECIDEMSKY